MAKKPKKEIKDSIDVEVQQAQEELAKEEQGAAESPKTKKPFNERYADFVTAHKIPVVSFCHQLFKVDLRNYKQNPSGLSNDTMVIKNASNKKRFFLRLSYLIGMLLLGFALIALGILFVSGVINTGAMTESGLAYLSGGLMAIGVVIIGIFI